jgi:hypothetical protein
VRWRCPQCSQRILRISGFIVSNTPDRTFTELRIARAYVRLSCIPEHCSEASVSLASIGNCEIRMFRGREADLEGMPLFWLELFDHSTKRSVDGFSCHRIKDAAPIFDDFVAQANRLNEHGGAEPQS